MNEEESVSFDSGWDSEAFSTSEAETASIETADGSEYGKTASIEAGEGGEHAETASIQAAGGDEYGKTASIEAVGDDSLAAFAAKHPQLKAESIPDEVWAQVASGETLESAWLRYQAKWSGLVMDEMARESRNRLRSTGSRRSEGGGNNSDPFDEGWKEI